MDWSSRIDDLCDHLIRLYGVEDRQVIEVLLACLVPCPRVKPPWIILETNWHSPNCYDGWFSFGKHWLPKSLAEYRGRKPWRQSEEELVEILTAPGDERLFIEPQYELYPQFPRLAQSLFVMDRCLRIRYKRPRTGATIPALDEQERDRRTDQLFYLARKVIEDPTKARAENPPKFNPPTNFLYHLELSERMSPWWRDWETVVENFGKLAARHAWMMGQEETGEEQVRILARVAQDSIPPWIAKALRQLGQGPSKPLVIQRLMTLFEESRRTKHGAHRELVRLRRNGLIQWNPLKMHWRLEDEYRAGILDVIDGYAFGRERPHQLSAAPKSA